ncbi:MAG: hypothetical protein WD972_00230 [Candidatus Andersenbacteria bacterium]
MASPRLTRWLQHSISYATIAALVVLLVAPAFYAHPAYGAALTQAYLRLDRMKASTTTGGTVCAKPASTATEADVQVTFPTGFTVNTTASNWTVTTTNLPAGATAWVSIATATAVSSQTVTFPSGDLVVGTLYCFNFSGTNTLTTSTAGSDKTGTIITRTSVPADIDTGNYATAVISDDQVVITATVPATFSFTLSANTDTLTLSSSSVVSGSGVDVTIATNAESGWITWLRSANAALNSASTGESIATSGTVDDSPATITGGSDGYVLDVDIDTDHGTGDGTVTVDPEYNGATTSAGGALSTTYTEIATANGTTAGDVITLIARATITAVKAAATDYTDTWTVVAAGNF